MSDLACWNLYDCCNKGALLHVALVIHGCARENTGLLLVLLVLLLHSSQLHAESYGCLGVCGRRHGESSAADGMAQLW